MRRRWLWGLGLWGSLGAAVWGQTPGTDPLRGLNLPPVVPGGPTGQGPAAEEPLSPRPTLPRETHLRPALPEDHPWRITPQTGPWFILVKSYSRPPRRDPQDPSPTALELAETLAREIRETHRVQAFLFEYISEERKQQMEAIAQARERARLFAEQLDKLRREAQLQGMEFLEPDRKIRVMTVNYNDQIAVLVGPFQSEEDASKALAIVKKWPAPKGQVRGASLMDWGVVMRPGPDGKPVMENGFLNPYVTAIVVPNPTVRRTPAQPQQGIDPLIVQLNEGRPYNLLRATKPWTLAVKSFHAPVQLILPGNAGLVRKPSSSASGADVLQAAAGQAEALAESLRRLTDAQGRPLGLETFVLHTRYGSVVTVGQFDSPYDPELHRVRELLQKLTLKVTHDRGGVQPVAGAPQLLDAIIPMPVPRPTPQRPQ